MHCEDSPPVTPTKVCTKCGRTLPATVDFFRRDAAKRDGLGPRCKECRASSDAAYYAGHREERLAYYAADYAAHREEHRAWTAAHNAAHPEENRKRAAAWAAAHPEEHRAHGAVYNAAHREERRIGSAAHYASHIEESRARCHNRRARLLSAPGTHTAADVAAQYLRQHGRCYWCGERVGKEYHRDHVFPVTKGGSNGRENLVIACPTCNLSKGAKLPHEFSDRLC